MIANTEVIAFCFDVGVCYLIVEELASLWLTGDMPVVEVQEPSKEMKLASLIEIPDRDEVGELAHESLYALMEYGPIALKLRTQ